MAVIKIVVNAWLKFILFIARMLLILQIDLIEQPFDREKKIKKGFCFITFESGDPVDMICVNQKHHLGGRDVRLPSSAIGFFLIFVNDICLSLLLYTS